MALGGLSGLSGLFGSDPTSISGLAAWYKSDAGITLDTSTGTNTVSTWANQAATGSSYNVAQATKANQPTYNTGILNGKPGLQFDGSNDALDFSGTGLALTNNIPGITGFFVMRPAAAGANADILAAQGGGGSGRLVFGPQGTNGYRLGTRRLDGDSFLSIASSNNAYVSNTSYYVTFNADFTSGTGQVWQNGASVASGTTSTSGGNTSATNAQAMRSGGLYSGIEYYNGYLFEILLYNRTLTASERQQVEAYLKLKYGL